MRRLRAAALATSLVLMGAWGLDVPTATGSTPPSQLAYVSGGAASVPQVWLLALPHGRVRRLGPGQEPALSPDGTIVAASAARQRGAALILYRSAGGVIRDLFDARLVTATAQAWSPDSRYLAVILTSRDPAGDAGSGLVVIDAVTLTWRLVTRGTIYGASFAPDGSDRIAYGAAASGALEAPVDIHVAAPDGSGASQITHDGRSLYPVWGTGAIAFDREQLRRQAAPEYQVWLMQPTGVQDTPLTGLAVSPLQDGPVPIAFSGDGRWLLAQYEGLDTSEAWAISIGTRQARRLEVGGRPVTAAACARAGAIALVDRGGYLEPPSRGAVEEVPLGGGRPRRLIAHASEPSWNL